MPLTKISTKIQRLAKIHFTYKHTKMHENTQDMTQNEINCIQIVKLISADFGQCLVILQCVLTVLSKEFQKEGLEFLIAP